MIPLLYNKSGNIKLGELKNCIECLVEEERNGLFELSLIYPTNDTLFNSLEEENIIVCNANDTLLNQKFRIYMTRKLMSNKIEVFARHISFDLAYDYINSIDIENQSCEYALNTIFRNSQFSTHCKGYSDIINAQDYKMSKVNCIEAIGGTSGSILDTFGTGAEILRDNTNIHVLNKRGHDNGVSIEYAKNLTGFELEEDYSELITRIIPFASYTDNETNEEILVEANAVDSDYISNYSHPYISYMDFSDKFEDKEIPTTEKLIRLAEKYFLDNECDKPKQNFKIEFVPLSKCVGYEGIQDNISLCDTVTIKDTRFNIDTKAKVIKTVFNVLKNKYESMELGEPRTTLGDIINSSSGGEDGKQGPPGPQGPPGQDGNIGDFPNSLPSTPVLSANVCGFASIELNWTYENKVYYNYELYGSKTKDFTPNTFDLIHAGQTSSYLFQAKPNETWYFRVCAVNTHGERTAFSSQVAVTTTKIDDMSNYFESAAIGNAVIGTLTSDYMEAGIIKGHYIDAKNLSVTDGNGKRTLDIDSFGNVNLNVTSLKVSSNSVATEDYVKDQINDSQITSIVKVETWFYISSSSISLSGGSWSTTSPTNVGNNKFVWTKTKTYFSDNTTSESNPFCITAVGSDGKGIKSIATQYYLSSSKTTQTGGSWVTTCPAWVSGKYLWIRYYITYTDNTTSYTSPFVDASWEKVNDLENTVNEIESRVTTAEQKITSDAIISTVTSSTTWKTQTNNITAAQNTANTAKTTANTANTTANTANATANTNKTNISNLTSRVSTAEQKITADAIVSTVTSSSTYKNALTGKVDTNKIISSINQTAESIKIKANKIQLNGSTTIGDGITKYVGINNGDYTLYDNGNARGFFGYKKMHEYDSSSSIPRLTLTHSGLNPKANSYFTIFPYPGINNPEGVGHSYVDICYSSPSHQRNDSVNGGTTSDFSNIKLYGDGNMRLAPVKHLTITSNYNKGSYPKNPTGQEYPVATFMTSSSAHYGTCVEVEALRRWGGATGLILAHYNDSEQGAFVRIGADSSGGRYFRPLTTDGNIQLGSGNYRWHTIFSVNAVNVSSDRNLKENIKYLQAVPNTKASVSESITTKDMYDFVKDDLYLAEYNFIGQDDKKLGFIAQDIVDTKIGEKITTYSQDSEEGKGDNYLGYDTSNYTNVLAGALKEAINEIEKLKEEIKVLKGGA